MKSKIIIKRIVDVLMTVALLVLMGYQFWGEQAHEWVGAGMFILFIAHQILNWNWYKGMFKGKYTPMRILQFCVNLLTLAAMLALMYSGIVMSRYVFTFLPIDGGMALARRLHILGSHWGFLLMSLHLGLHWNMVLAMGKKKAGSMTSSRLRQVVLFFVGLAIAVYGAYVFIQRDFLTYMLLQNEFVFLDYEEPRILFYFDYLALMGLGVFVSHYSAKMFRKMRRRQKREVSK